MGDKVGAEVAQDVTGRNTHTQPYCLHALHRITVVNSLNCLKNRPLHTLILAGSTEGEVSYRDMTGFSFHPAINPFCNNYTESEFICMPWVVLS